MTAVLQSWHWLNFRYLGIKEETEDDEQKNKRRRYFGDNIT